MAFLCLSNHHEWYEVLYNLFLQTDFIGIGLKVLTTFLLCHTTLVHASTIKWVNIFLFIYLHLFPLDSVDKFSQCILIFESIDLNVWFPEELLRLLSFWYIWLLIYISNKVLHSGSFFLFPSTLNLCSSILYPFCRKRRLSKKEFFPCSNVPPWCKLLDKEIMFA